MAKSSFNSRDRQIHLIFLDIP